MQNKPLKGTGYIDIKSELKKEELYKMITEFLLNIDVMIECRDPEIGLIRTGHIDVKGRIDTSYYSIRIQDNKVTISGNYRAFNQGAALVGIVVVKVRDLFAQIINLDNGQVGRKQAFRDMLALAEKFGDVLEFRN